MAEVADIYGRPYNQKPVGGVHVLEEKSVMLKDRLHNFWISTPIGFQLGVKSKTKYTMFRILQNSQVFTKQHHGHEVCWILAMAVIVDPLFACPVLMSPGRDKSPIPHPHLTVTESIHTIRVTHAVQLLLYEVRIFIYMVLDASCMSKPAVLRVYVLISTVSLPYITVNHLSDFHRQHLKKMRTQLGIRQGLDPDGIFHVFGAIIVVIGLWLAKTTRPARLPLLPKSGTKVKVDTGLDGKSHSYY